jgi:cyclohexanone monooxygenase
MRERQKQIDVVIVGAGFAGMYAIHLLRQRGYSLLCIEAGDSVGGTWHWNRYPGARCDVETLEYQFSFAPELQQEWTWSERYAGQEEILRYQNFVADRLDLRRDIQFQTRVSTANWDEDHGRWIVGTDRGDRISARFCVMATGTLSAARKPEISGADSFAGPSYHTGHWPKEQVDFTGRSVGVIGTGSSGIQIIPMIAKQAAHLTVFQRTPSFTIPAHNRSLNEDEVAEHKRIFGEIKQKARQTMSAVVFEPGIPTSIGLSPMEVNRAFDARWQKGGYAFIATFDDLLINPETNAVAADYVRSKIRAIVKDPTIAEMLSPRDHPFGTKRLCLDTDYFETYNRMNVTLVDIRRDPIRRITPEGILLGKDLHKLDVIVYATGFDAITGALSAIDIYGRNGVSLAEKWRFGPRTYLGIATAGFPNMFLITGPGSPSVLANVIMSGEQHVRFAADIMDAVRIDEHVVMEPEAADEDNWVEHVNALADGTLYPQANSWYLGANIPGKPRVFMPYVGGWKTYCDHCDEEAAARFPHLVQSFKAQNAKVIQSLPSHILRTESSNGLFRSDQANKGSEFQRDEGVNLAARYRQRRGQQDP